MNNRSACSVFWHLQLRAEAVGSSRRGAEKMAASDMLEKLVDKVDD